ncbi:uncharacterized protein [Amphiura filiformis]|uniref:uncharacterized protein n=1 Tax=Amphiura filiformis TaxID=82378 RepID=UPI003B213941
MINYFVFFIWFLNASIESVLTQRLSDRHCRYDFEVTPGIELRDFVIDNVYVSTSQKCALRCLSRADCMSFNYQDFTELCQLNSASLSCVPDHVIFNGTMRHFSPPKARCWKELCRASSVHKPNSIYKGPVKATKLKKSKLTHKGSVFVIANFL